MDDDKLEELITNLELVGCKLDTLLEKDLITGEQKKTVDEASEIIRKTLDDLRIVEVRREIDSHTDLD